MNDYPNRDEKIAGLEGMVIWAAEAIIAGVGDADALAAGAMRRCVRIADIREGGKP